MVVISKQENTLKVYYLSRKLGTQYFPLKKYTHEYKKTTFKVNKITQQNLIR